MFNMSEKKAGGGFFIFIDDVFIIIIFNRFLKNLFPLTDHISVFFAEEIFA